MAQAHLLIFVLSKGESRPWILGSSSALGRESLQAVCSSSTSSLQPICLSTAPSSPHAESSSAEDNLDVSKASLGFLVFIF